MKIACIGEPMIELSTRGDPPVAQISFAGDTLNTAVYLRRCAGAGHEVGYITVLGTDTFSDQIVATLHAEQLNDQHVVRISDRVPGLYAISTDAAGERSFTYWRDQSAARLLFDESAGPSFDALADYDVIYYSAITLAILPERIKDQFLAYLTQFRQGTGKQVSFDSNYRPKLWVSAEQARHYTTLAWQQCDIALPSVDDEMALFEESNESAVLDRLSSCGVSAGALKRGELGPLDIATRTSASGLARVHKVIDSTAAGDSFNGAYLASLLSNNSPQDALRSGHGCASYVIQHQGAIVPRTQ